MSYILDALKKSEQERDLGRIPTLTDASPAGVVGSGRKNLPVIGALLLAVLAVLLALYSVFNGQFPESSNPLETPQVAVTGINEKAPEAPEQKESSGISAPVTLPAIDESKAADEKNEQPIPTPAPEKTVTAVALQPEAIPVTAPTKQTMAAAPPKGKGSSTLETTASGGTRNEQKAPPESAAAEISQSPEVVVIPPPPEKTVSKVSVAKPSLSPQTLPAAKNTESGKPVKTEAPPAKAVPKARPGTEHVLPYDVYRRLPKRKISALAYSAVPERRFVIVNSQKLREKESTEEGLVVEEILNDGVIFSFQGHRFFRKLIP
jgi:general secretion pathway protein B